MTAFIFMIQYQSKCHKVRTFRTQNILFDKSINYTIMYWDKWVPQVLGSLPKECLDKEQRLTKLKFDTGTLLTSGATECVVKWTTGFLLHPLCTTISYQMFTDCQLIVIYFLIFSWSFVRNRNAVWLSEWSQGAQLRALKRKTKKHKLTQHYYTI